MVSKVLIFLALAAIVSQGNTAAVVWLNDVTVTHISSAWHPFTIGLGHFWFETLVTCNVIFPNGVIYEVYPNNRLTDVATVSYITGSAFGPGCSIAFSNSPPSLSGTYEMMSLVEHQDKTQTLTRQRTTVTFIMSEVVFPSAAEESVKTAA